MLRDSRTKTWNFHAGTLIHTYDFDYTAARSIDVSPDNTKIIAPNGIRTSLLRARWTPVTSVEEESEEPELMLVYPNPGTDEVWIDLTNHTLKFVVESVRVYDVLGKKYMDSRLRGNDNILLDDDNIKLFVNDLPNGEYIIVIEGRERKISRKLIINR
jgi:hypothetical protein